jgi:SHS2 domain-containing protein
VPYRFAEHGGEVELELEATAEHGVLEAAVEAFADLVSGESGAESECHPLELDAPDRGLLLADLLNELVYLAEVQHFVPRRLETIELAGGRLRATVLGHRGHPRHLVKAVTLNRLMFEGEDGAWHGRVVLDV